MGYLVGRGALLLGTHKKGKHRIMRGPGPCSQVGCNLGFLPLQPRDICEDIWLPHQPTPCCKVSFCFGGLPKCRRSPSDWCLQSAGLGFQCQSLRMWCCSGPGVPGIPRGYAGMVPGIEPRPGACWAHALMLVPSTIPPHQEVNISRASQKWWLLSISLPSP